MTEAKTKFVLKVGDTLTDIKGRTGVIKSISIAMTPSDYAAESDLAVDVQEYHTVLDYQGAVTFGNYWCYFSQIQKVETEIIVNEETETVKYREPLF